MTIKAEQIRKWVSGVNEETAAKFAEPLAITCERFDINTPKRIAHFIGQIAHESGSFTILEENLRYSASRMMIIWPKRFPTIESAIPYQYQPEKLANKVYCNRMGNGDELSGDGWRYRGRGLIQTTGRDAYRICGRAIGLPVEEQPDLLKQPLAAALSAGWEWSKIGANALADVGDIDRISDLINIGHATKLYGDSIGFPDRVYRTNYALKAMGVK